MMRASDTVKAPIRYDALAWGGVVGSALSLFSRLDGAVEFSSGARIAADAWGQIMQAAANAVTGVLGLGTGLIPKEYVVLLSLAASVLATVLGVRLKAAALEHECARPGLRLGSAWMLLPLVIVAIVLSMASLWVASRSILVLAPLHGLIDGKGVLLVALLLIAFVSSVPFALLARNRTSALAFAAVFAPVPVMLAQIPLLMKQDILLPVTDTSALAAGLGMALAATLVPLALYLAPTPALVRRFVLVLVGVAGLIALNAVARRLG
ncbi:MAG: hypothetical protein R3D44_16450 [Hyphomicrobiaceae bacterium]